VNARIAKDLYKEGRAIFKMEGLMVGTMQHLGCVMDFLIRPHWKPSEEQMYSLGTVVKGAGDNSVGSIAYNLKELYEQLKTLMIQQ
jgi:hypothetical protein